MALYIDPMPYAHLQLSDDRFILFVKKSIQLTSYALQENQMQKATGKAIYKIVSNVSLGEVIHALT